ncbi:MAG: uroporphyrinogen decarboxylase family protein [Armatimonadota bacterium]|nr:uroporphyrinogen decarboxylase family protein [Armatimonadota bacterium]
MTSRERITAAITHQEADRIPMHDSPWASTIERWRREGLPEDVSVAEYFGFDAWRRVTADLSPRYPAEVLEETDEYIISTTVWGETSRRWKHRASVPEFLDFRIKDRASWEEARERMDTSEDRVDWQMLEENWPKWREEGAFIEYSIWGPGYDVWGNRVVGTERFLMALVEDPQWCREMQVFAAERGVYFGEMILERGYDFDGIRIPDDLGYRNGLLMSPETFDATIRPAHEILCDWAKQHNKVRWLHSCGNVMALVPRFVDEIGWNVLNPLEIKAGMDPIALKEQYGGRLALDGGIDVRMMLDPDDMEREVAGKIPVLKEGGGYVYHSDHSVPDNVSFDSYCRLMELVREYGSYD